MKCKGKKLDGDPCGMAAVWMGYCLKHQSKIKKVKEDVKIFN